MCSSDLGDAVPGIGGVLAWLTNTAFSALLGAVLGAVVLAVVTGVKNVRAR